MNFSEQSWAVTRGHQGGMDQDKGLKTPGSTGTLVLLLFHPSPNDPRQRLDWVQSSRPCLQKLAGEGKRDREELRPSLSLSLRHLLSRDPFKPGAPRGNRKQGGGVYLAIYSSSRTCAPWGLGTEDSLGARGEATRVVPDALL